VDGGVLEDLESENGNSYCKVFDYFLVFRGFWLMMLIE
jgi:hypothetical protein